MPWGRVEGALPSKLLSVVVTFKINIIEVSQIIINSHTVWKLSKVLFCLSHGSFSILTNKMLSFFWFLKLLLPSKVK